MAMVRCAECNCLVSSKTVKCLKCGYSPIGNCENCVHFEEDFSETVGKCTLAKDESVRKDKSVCPAVIKRFMF